jgi:hypothetical protein
MQLRGRSWRAGDHEERSQRPGVSLGKACPTSRSAHAVVDTSRASRQELDLLDWDGSRRQLAAWPSLGGLDTTHRTDRVRALVRQPPSGQKVLSENGLGQRTARTTGSRFVRVSVGKCQPQPARSYGASPGAPPASWRNFSTLVFISSRILRASPPSTAKRSRSLALSAPWNTLRAAL